MQFPSFHPIHAGFARKRSLRLAAIVVLVAATLAIAGGKYAGTSHAARAPQHRTGAAGVPAQSATLTPFDASGLPAGHVMGLPIHASFPAGTNLKHIHGGPTYVYVISGSLDILDTDGTRTTYDAGSFFWEGPGHIHTVQVAQGVEVFELQLLPPGAESLVPVQ